MLSGKFYSQLQNLDYLNILLKTVKNYTKFVFHV